MANPHKSDLSKGLAEMKFMKRNSTGQIDYDSGGPLTDRWLARDVPQPSSHFKGHVLSNSYVEFEDLNQFGRYSYNSYNKDIERMMIVYKRKWEGQEEGEYEEEEDETEVSVKVSEMAKRYQDFGISVEKKKHRKR